VATPPLANFHCFQIVSVNSDGGVLLLTIEPDLARGIPAEELAEATRLIRVPAYRIDRGDWDMRTVNEWEFVHGDPVGILVLDGIVIMSICVAERWCSRTLGSGELILLDDVEGDSVPMDRRWRAGDGAHVAVLDERFMLLARRWPSLMRSMLMRAAISARYAFVQQAFSQLPRVEDRILAFLWSVADRHGQTAPDGVRLHLSLTHQDLGEMIGARRPTVSLGLSQLVKDGLLREHNGDWWLSRESLTHFPSAAAVV
jgi:CRP/FNR family cyclic AMP-dependent transcriptional regulator